MSKFRVGAGMASLDYPIEKYPAQSFSVVCEDKYDDCNTRAIAIESDDRTVLLLAFELSDIPEAPDLEKKISEATGVPVDDIIITVTHNHTSPCDRAARMCSDQAAKDAFRREFFVIETESAIKAATDAVKSLRPARYGYGEINSYIANNELTRNPQIGYYCDPEGNGYTDNTLAIVKFIDENDRPICFLMNHPCHATCAMGKDANGKYATSGNFTGITCRFLEEYYGGGVIATWTAGASGNLHPIHDANIRFNYTDGYTGEYKLPDGAGHLLMERTGRQHAIDAINCIDKIAEFTDEMKLAHVKDFVMIPTQMRPGGNAVISNTGKPPKRPDYGPALHSNQPEPAAPFVAPEIVPCPDDAKLQMELLSFGDVAIVGIGCELFCQIGRDIKNAIPAKHTIVVTHTPGYVGDNPQAVGYITDKTAIGSTNIKVFRNLIPGAYDETIVNLALDLYGRTL